MTKKKLGIIGGVGPLATMFVGEMIVRRSKAETDQQHIHSIISNNTSIPDRTAFLLDRSLEDPVPYMVEDAAKLHSIGAEVIIIPCNTVHCFFDELQAQSPIPIINMVRETVEQAAAEGSKKIGILATTGTVTTAIYQEACREFGLEAILPDRIIQEDVMSIIYDNIKAGKPIDESKWKKISAFMADAACDRVILACTELSFVKKELDLSDFYLDSLLVLADRAIEACGYELTEKALTFS